MDLSLSVQDVTRLPVRAFPRDWEGKTAVVVGNGPSLLAPEWPDRVLTAGAAAKVLVANGGYKLFPFANVLMCSDRHWLAANPDLSGFKGETIVVTRPEAIRRLDRRMVHLRRAFIEKVRGDIFADPKTLVEGHTSTSTNISLAVLRGAARIVLVGIDLTPGPALRRRAYDESRDTLAAAQARYDRQVKHLTMQAAHVRARGVDVLNASPRSALACYPYVSWGEIQW
jgi:hypothetical protein